MNALGLWAKKDYGVHLLEYHLIDTASVCKQYLAYDERVLNLLSDGGLINSTNISNLLCFLCSIHDIGKTSTLFQIPKETAFKYRHDVGGYLLLTEDEDILNILMESFNLDNNRKTKRKIRILLRTAAMHHGSPKGCADDSQKNKFPDVFDDNSRSNALTILQRMIDLYGRDIDLNSIIASEHFDRISNIIAGVINQCDWIASGEFDYCSEQMSLNDYKTISESKAESIFSDDYLNIGRKNIGKPEFEDIFGFKPSPIQTLLSNVSETNGLYIIEDATGSGKTEGSLILALMQLSKTDLDGITFALPTRSTSNMMYLRLKGYASGMIQGSKRSIGLQHSSSKAFLTNEGIQPDDGWTCGKNKSLFANISVCTVDQILGSVLPVRYQPLKLLSVGRHVIIIDEVHAYDAYAFNLLCALIRYCKTYNVPIILLSATIPSQMKMQLVESYFSKQELDNSPYYPSTCYPLVTICKDRVVEETCECSERSVRKIAIRYESNQDSMMNEMIDLASKGHRVCWIRNTVDDALEAYDSIPEGTYRKLLIHSRFIQTDRISKEKILFELCGKDSKESGLIVVSTQVIEQSLDIEFERIYSDLAPMDSMLQRMGRDQRFGNSSIDCEFVTNGPDLNGIIDSKWYSDYFKRGAFVYDNHSVLYNTAIALSKGTISIPSDYRDLIEFAYSKPDATSPFYNNYVEFQQTVNSWKTNADNHTLNPDVCYGGSISESISDSSWDLIEDVKTRITDDRTRQCLLLKNTPNGFEPMSGDIDTSCVNIKRKFVQTTDNEDLYNYGKWEYVPKIKMEEKRDDNGNPYWISNEGVRYSKERGIEYVQLN